MAAPYDQDSGYLSRASPVLAECALPNVNVVGEVPDHRSWGLGRPLKPDQRGALGLQHLALDPAHCASVGLHLSGTVRLGSVQLHSTNGHRAQAIHHRFGDRVTLSIRLGDNLVQPLQSRLGNGARA